MKKNIFFLLASLLALSAVGQGDMLYVNLTSHQSSTYDLGGISKLTFSETAVHVVEANGAINAVPYSSLRSLTFALPPVAPPIDSVIPPVDSVTPPIDSVVPPVDSVNPKQDYVELISPTDNATGVATSVTLTWKAVENAVEYYVFLGTTADSMSQIGTTTSTSYLLDSLQNGRFYYWSVVVLMADGTYTEYWELRTFVTKERATAVEKGAENSLIAVYPNPVKDFITVESEQEMTDILVYDQSGVRWLHSKPAAQHATLSLQGVPAGVYIIQVLTRDGKSAQKIIKN